jgi:hypothetical protein
MIPIVQTAALWRCKHNSCGSELAREDGISATEDSAHIPASARASSLHNPWVARYIGGVGMFDKRAFARKWDLPALDIA